MKNPAFTPKLFSLLRSGISRQQIFKDLTAGVIVGIVALPLAIAFAIASGVSPDKGIITAIIGGFIISVLGGSRVQIGGPTGAFIVIVYAIVQEHGFAGLTIATFMAGFMLIGMGLLRLGTLLRYIPHSLIVGFTSGIAVIIFSSQIKDLFGLPVTSVPADFLEKWKLYGHHIQQVNGYALLIGAATILIAFNFHRISSKIPGSVAAILLSTFAVYWFDLPVATIETTFGEIPNHFSAPAIPAISFETVKSLLQPALAIALLGGIESLLSALVADGMTGGRHRPNAELIAQGTANCFSAMFGGIPATGAIARTATNVKNGGRTPIAGIVHVVVLLLIMLLLAPLAKLIPMACLAGILIVVSYHMSEWRQFRSLLKGKRLDVLVLLVTFVLTVVFDLVIAIEVGIVLSAFVLMKRVGDSMKIEDATAMFNEREGEMERLFEEELPAIPSGVTIFEISGPLFFGAAQTFQDNINQLQKKPKVLILRMRHVPFIDATGTYRLKELIRQNRQKKVSVILSGVNVQVKTDLEKADVYAVLPPENLLDHIDAALLRARELIE